MLFDTHVLVWVLRGNAKAAKTMNDAAARAISVVTYMELLQGAQNPIPILVPAQLRPEPHQIK